MAKSNNIYLNDTELNNVLNALDKSIQSIQISKVKAVPKLTTSSGVMLEKYIERINDISKLLTSFQQLLQKDLKDIRSAQKLLIDADKQAATNFQTSRPSVSALEESPNMKIVYSKTNGKNGSW